MKAHAVTLPCARHFQVPVASCRGEELEDAWMLLKMSRPAGRAHVLAGERVGLAKDLMLPLSTCSKYKGTDSIPTSLDMETRPVFT